MHKQKRQRDYSKRKRSHLTAKPESTTDSTLKVTKEKIESKVEEINKKQRK